MEYLHFRNSPTAPEMKEIFFDEEKTVESCPLNSPPKYVSYRPTGRIAFWYSRREIEAHSTIVS